MFKVIRIGKVKPNRKKIDVFCKIKFDGKRLSISGVVGPLQSGNVSAGGGCGQIVGSVAAGDFVEFADGWNKATVSKFFELWDRWHLNDLQAGSPAQQEAIRNSGLSYQEAVEKLEALGLNPDPNYLHNNKPYRYGSAWLMEEVPQEVIDFLDKLPTADTQPAWV